MIEERLSHYTILERLGAGGMGEVYRARDGHLDREVAIKVLPEALAADEKNIARLHREAKLASQLSHPSIATIYDSDEVDGSHFIVMELVKGETLSTKIKPGGLTLDEILGIAIPLAEGLAEAHEAGIVHRDLKPGNVMLDARGRVKILDFGLSRPLPESDLTTAGLTSSGVVMGTPHYMSPEQMRGEELDARSDLFSLGVILYELATGARPFGGESLAVVMRNVLGTEPTPLIQVRPNLGELLAHTIDRLLEKDPAHRVQHATDLVEELRSLQRPSTAIIVQPQRTRWWIPLVGAAVALAAALGIWTRLPLEPVDQANAVAGPLSAGTAKPVLAIVPFAVSEEDEDAATIARTLLYCLPEGLDSPGIDLLTARFLGDRAKRRGIEPGTLDSETGREIAVEAGATLMLVGQVERGAGGLDIHCELLDTGTGRHLATRNLFAVQSGKVRGYVEDLAATIFTSLGVDRQGGTESVSLSDSPMALEAWAKGLVAYDAADWLEAERQFERAVVIDPAFAVAHYFRARALWWLFEREDLGRARDAGKAAIALSDRLSPVNQAKVEVFLEIIASYPRLSTPGLLATARELAVENPRDKDALDLWMEVACHHVAEGSPEETITACERLIDLDPEYAPAYVHLLTVGTREDVLRKAAQGIVDHAPESEFMPRALLVLGRTEEARRIIRDRGRDRTPEHRRRALLVATILEEYELVTETSPEQEDPTHLIALGRFEEARSLVNGGVAQAIERVELGIVPPAPNTLETRLCRVVGLARGGKVERAESELDEIYESALVDPALRPLALWARAEIDDARGSDAKAVEGFLKAVPEREEPSIYDGFLLQRAARALMEVGRYEQAETLLRRIEEEISLIGVARPEWWVAPRNRSRWDLALCREEAGDIEGALDLLERFLKHWHEPDEAFPEIAEALSLYVFLSGHSYVPE